MNGRALFRKLSWVICIINVIFKFIPNIILKFILLLLDNSESKIALLFRYLYVKKRAKNCGENIFIGRNVVLKNLSKLDLGSNISIHSTCYLDAAGEIKIEDNVSIANQTSLISFEHTWENSEIPIKYNPVKLGKIHICEDVWIGCGCRILSNVKINSRSIVAAGAVVNKNFKESVIVGGVPAKVIKEI